MRSGVRGFGKLGGVTGEKLWVRNCCMICKGSYLVFLTLRMGLNILFLFSYLNAFLGLLFGVETEE